MQKGSSTGNRCQIIPGDDPLRIETCRNRPQERCVYYWLNAVHWIPTLHVTNNIKGWDHMQCDILSRSFPKILNRQALGSLETSVFSSGTASHSKRTESSEIPLWEPPMSLVWHFALTTEYITFVTGSALCFLQSMKWTKVLVLMKILSLPLPRHWCGRDNFAFFIVTPTFSPLLERFLSLEPQNLMRAQFLCLRLLEVKTPRSESAVVA
jgi:hypothetical protein